MIDDNDAIFLSLRLWQDKNHNGISEPDELHTLASLNVKALELDFKYSRRMDQHGKENGKDQRDQDIAEKIEQGHACRRGGDRLCNSAGSRCHSCQRLP